LLRKVSELSIYTPFAAITDNPQSAAEEIAQRFRSVAPDLQSEQLLVSPHALIGSVDQIVVNIQERRERYGLSYYLIPQDQLEAFAPVVARLAGT
jgi:hypothetical protein